METFGYIGLVGELLSFQQAIFTSNDFHFFCNYNAR